jgi:putative ABC transport system permease protein
MRNHLLLILRYMHKQKGFSVINITGLTIGISCSLLLALYVYDELRYDSFHSNAPSIYRITYHSKLQGKQLNTAFSPALLSVNLRNDVPEITEVTRIAAWKTFPIRYHDKSFTENYLLLADADFFRFFTFDLIHGNIDDVLKGERKIVITASTAMRYFGRADSTVIGETLLLAQGYKVNVSGLAEDPPSWSHFHFTHILSLDSWVELPGSSWLSPRVHTYIKSATPVGQLLPGINTHLHKHIDEELHRTRSTTYDQFSATANVVELGLQPLLDIHLRSSLADEIEQNGNIQYVYLFLSIAIFIALLACINFINLSTARSASRAKEVGIRKTVGASTFGLMKQFLFESYFYIILSVLLSIFVVAVVLGPFNYFTGKQLPLSLLFGFKAMAGILALTLIIGFLAGSYPSLYLTRFSPVEVLRGKLREQLRRFGVRNILVLFQFFISSALILATLIVYAQLIYVQQMNLGFSKENIINLLHTKNLDGQAQVFKAELMKLEGVEQASFANRLPPDLDWTAPFHPQDSEKEYLMTVYEMDYDHLETMKLTMVKGRFFSRDIPADTNAIIINESAMKAIGWSDITDKEIFSGYDTPSGRNRQVIGVIKDFHFRSAREPIQPLAVVLGNEPGWEMAIRVSGNTDDAMKAIAELWHKVVPHAAFEARLVEQNLSDSYRSEKRMGLVFLVFTILAIFIACLGLFGLAAFTAEQRTKEIGIRKVLGAGVVSIVLLLNRNFLTLVLLSNVLAFPLAGWYMNRWLRQFEYHISVSVWQLIVTAAITIVIAFLSVSYQAIRAARLNPVRSLRND